MLKYKREYSISEERLREIFDNFKNKKVLIIGDIMLDKYVFGDVERISPEAPVPVVTVINEKDEIGGAGNVAKNIKSLGANPILLSVIGNDGVKKEIIDLMIAENLETDFLVNEEKRQTTKKTRIIARHQQIVRIDREDICDIKIDTEKMILEKIYAIKNEIDGIIISDYGKGVITKGLLEQIVGFANENDIFISVDPKDKNFNNYRNVSLITPNNHEASRAFGEKIIDEESLIRAGKGLLEKMNCQNLLITRGENGMTLFTQCGEYKHFPTVALEVFDVTGAGDTVISTFTLAVIAGATMQEAAWISNHAASIVIREVGAQATTTEELFQALHEEYIYIQEKK